MKNIKETSYTYMNKDANNLYKEYILTYYENKKGKYYIPEDQKYFGLIIESIYYYVPSIGTENENGVIKDYYSYICIDDNLLSSIDKPLPLIFRVVKESNGKIECAEEVLSGIKIRFASEENELDEIEFNNLGEFQLKFDEVKNNPLILIPETMPIKVDDEYKKLVARSLIGREEKIKTVLQDAEEYAKKTFEKDLNIYINDAYDLAYVDNMLLDFEKKLTLTNKEQIDK